MGNCSIKGTTGECHHSIRVLSDSGAILQFKGPITVAQVLQRYPGYGIFRQGHASSPLPEHESLSYGLFYYLLPLKEVQNDQRPSNSVSVAASDYVKNLSNGSALEVLPSAKNGVWRVKLVIETRQLEEILSEQVNTEALIEKMRMAATACSTTTSPTRSRTMSTWKMGWKPTLFFNTFWAPVNSGKITKSNAAAGSGLDLGSC
ncbi:uncharacterized protein LOC133295995 [Gastrolobium bilobum]|uniref:uncharacterized protein LOC133295995 n=1 Tax=Gastrolobium bilobum TaxID=150636 RepID=UPI002AB17A6B|nr:uncharacterized protein LOC133295995 [Gastrolobium bilobum]